jgi:hypothetical protein
LTLPPLLDNRKDYDNYTLELDFICDYNDCTDLLNVMAAEEQRRTIHARYKQIIKPVLGHRHDTVLSYMGWILLVVSYE